MKRALIAMSGGVDSSVAAYKMKEAGFECIGATMKLFENEDLGIVREKTCCALDDVADAERVAAGLGIPYHVFNFTEDFREKVIGHFIEAYECGQTPNPCIDCNRYLKFDRFFHRAMELDCDYVVTGHYARIEERDGRYLLKKAVDETKDQSYVLYSLTQFQLAHTIFPLGEMRKTETRAEAQAKGLANAQKKESQDICFVPDGDYAAAIRRFTGKVYPEGDFTDMDGNILGTHKGIIKYTIGQRKGLGLALKAPMYVCSKDMKNNRVILGKNEDLFTRELDVYDVNWIAWDKPPEEIRAKVRIRYKQAEQWASIFPSGDRQAHIVFDEPQRAITSGQAAVMYDGDIVVGGGTIR